MYAFRFSIDDHKLTVMATDGYVVQPVEVDYIAIHAGERYDFLLEATLGGGDHWIRAETFEIGKEDSTAPPYNFLDHKAEAILHYSGSEKPTPAQFQSIPSAERQCTEGSTCKMLNCPFGRFHSSYAIECISIDSLRLFTPTPESEMPDETPDITYFINMAGFVFGVKPVSSINDKHFAIPKNPLTMHYEDNDKDSFCDVNSECEEERGCQCTTVMDVGNNETVRLVISAVGEERRSTHPIHVHGHSVHLLKVGYGEYSAEDGSLLGSSRDLTCTADGDDSEILDTIRCPNPRFRSPDVTFPLDQFTLRKDTFIVPSGGYVVVEFRSDNPGYWLLSCNNELYYREGMALVIREAVNRINPPPEQMETCQPFIWEVHDFMSAIEVESGSGFLVVPNIGAIMCLIIVNIML
jgi:FtsP/CotA-like multicopper oxidase with cupredoxin domain